MNNQTVQYSIRLTLNAPILTQTSGAIGFGLDTAMCRDASNRPAISGSLIKGNLRHAWDELFCITGTPETAAIKRWLGDESPEQSNDEPLRGKLSFSQYWCDESYTAAKEEGKRYRISIDEATGAVKQGALQVIESPYPIGATPSFIGTITVTLPENEHNELKKWLLKGFNFIPAVGALKGSGFGRVEEIAITSTVLLEANSEIETSLIENSRLGLRITLGSPICFAKPAIGKSNHFETETTIPGAALVAAIANRTATESGRWPHIEKHLSQLCITHAHPVQTGMDKRPVAIPLSLVKAGDKFHNIAEQKCAELIDDEAPVFLIDWKEDDWGLALASYNPPNNPDEATIPEKVLAIRTKIDAKTQSAEKEKLFSMESISPNGFEWLANLDISHIDELEARKALTIELHDLFKQPLTHLGKTKASATIKLNQPFGYTTKMVHRDDDKVIIYLQTPARLLPTAFHCNGTNDGEQLKKAYRKSWEELSGRSLELSHFYAQQRLLGGSYWWNRFRKPHLSDNHNYHPEIFTTAGSVFVFKIKDRAKAGEKIRHWQARGLPQLNNAPGGESWQQNPWIATNGYGEIAINLDHAQSEMESHDE